MVEDERIQILSEQVIYFLSDSAYINYA